MALKIDPDGTETVMEPESKRERFHTETLQKAVGGYIEVVTLPRPVEHEGEQYYAMICDENGKRKNLNVNDRATVLWAKAQGVPVGSLGDYLVGTVLFVKKGEVPKVKCNN